MSILSNAELLSVELGTIKLSSDSKKIKFKQESYSNIIRKYIDFCKNVEEIYSKAKKDCRGSVYNKNRETVGSE